ncbi:MAG: DUF1540 domain-containing protein [Negativicutes bacterium]|nr:DUF1540 domain-containing protein [Negativicutes bacterium]
MATQNPMVKCTVDQCTHWMNGNQCMAARISVYNDESSGTSRSADDTQCKSFHERKTVGDMVGALHNANVGGTMMAAFADGKQIMPSVECFVNNCVHWSSGNMCHAGTIEIAGRNAAKTQDTDCETFRAK